MFGKLFKSQFYIIATSLLVLIYSLGIFNMYFFEYNKSFYYMKNRLSIKYLENYIKEAELLLINQKFERFISFSEFFYNISKLRNKLINILFFNVSIADKAINYSLFFFSEKNLSINISSDKTYVNIELLPKKSYWGNITYENSSLLVLKFENLSFNISCKKRCIYLLIKYIYDKNEIIKIFELKI